MGKEERDEYKKGNRVTYLMAKSLEELKRDKEVIMTRELKNQYTLKVNKEGF